MDDEAARAVFTSGDAFSDVAKKDAPNTNDVLVQLLGGGAGNINHGVGTNTSAVGDPVDFGVDYGSHRLECSKSIVSARGECEAACIAVGANEGTRTRVVGANLVRDTANAGTADADDAANHLRRAALGNRTLEGIVVARHCWKVGWKLGGLNIVICIVLITTNQIF